MNQLVYKLFQGNTQQALDKIDTIYTNQGFCVLSYVYGAVIIRHRLLHIDGGSLTPWQESLLSSSLVLPDGAALRTRRRVAHYLGVVSGVTHLHNLNGTDFFPQLLEYYLSQGPVNLVCYGTYGGNLPTTSGDIIVPAGEWLQERYGITWSYWQDVEYNDTHTQWDWDKMRAACNPSYPTIMMVCLGVPRQELWSYENREYLKKYGVIACNQGATIDYWAGREVRAHRLVRRLRLESVWRLLSDPRKNRSKFWVSFAMMGEIVCLFISKIFTIAKKH